jgi:general secretion pathway protein E/type IV pilus assembly protein PilB
MPAEDPILESLVQMKVLAQDLLAIETSMAKEHGIPVLEQLLADAVVTQKDVACAKAAHYGISYVDLASKKPSKEALESIPKELIARYHIFPFMVVNDVVYVAIADIADMFKLDSLQGVLGGKNFEAHMTEPGTLNQAISRYCLAEAVDLEQEAGLFAAETPAAPDPEDAPLIKLVDQIFSEADRRRASDIHFEPVPGEFIVRCRIDGVMHILQAPPVHLQAAIISRLKIQAGMSIDVKRLPQDGRIRRTVNGKELDMRVSCIPTSNGESIVIRILDKSSLALNLETLGFGHSTLERLKEVISYPDGMFLVTGPTGSGKTTSLYSVLNTLNQEDRKIITVEDPVEYLLSGVNQVQVNEATGMTFATVLRSMLRQSPNIIMLGEIRDIESANIAMNAALTGHLVFSTLHTNDAPSAVTRLIDMGVKPFLIATAARAFMAQRLIRRICPGCAKPYTPPPRELEQLKLTNIDLSKSNIRKGLGCASCFKSGFKGREGIYELMLVDDPMQRAIYQHATSDDMRKLARKSGMNTLREDGIQKVLQGITTPLEVIAATLNE